MGIEGALSEVGLADICQLLAMGRKTGRLSITDRSNFAHIYFEDGLVIHAVILNRPDRLADLLVGNGAVAPQALREARSRRSGEPGERHYARILADEGALSPQDLERYVAVTVEEAVYRLFMWEDGSFTFQGGISPDRGIPAQVHIPIQNLLLEGARRADEWTQIRQVVPSDRAVFRVASLPGDGSDEGPSREQRRVLELLDGERTIDDIVRSLGTVEFEVSRILFEMAGEGWVAREVDPSMDEALVPSREESPAQGHMELARAFHDSGMLEEAERELKQVLEHRPSDPEAHSRLAVIALRTRRPGEALRHLDMAEEASGDSYSRLRNRALALELLHRYPEALEALDRAAVEGGDDPGLHLARGLVLLKLARGEEALEAFHRHREALPQEEVPTPRFFAYAVLAAEVAGNSQEALELGREGLGYHPGSGPILVNLGAVLERRGEVATAEALYLRAVGGTDTPPQAHRNLGDLALRRGDQASARAHYERAVRLNPKLGDEVFLRLGTLFYEDGDMDGARTLWQRALKINPDNEMVRTNLGLVTAGAGS
ncbi:MAG: tetratricopeptide repeat protein [Gemmatimonadales bacterium]|nr:MAG: tetratricopeptide repeat protein [Gemmatimonadales bacterium]